MPVRARWEEHGAYFTCLGLVVANEVLGAPAFMLDPPEGITPEYQIIDARKVERFEFNQMDVLNISASDLRVAKKYPNIKIAFIRSNNVQEETIIEYLKTSWSMGTKAEFRIFNDLKTARDWIGLPYPEEKDDTNSQEKGPANSLSLPSDR